MLESKPKGILAKKMRLRLVGFEIIRHEENFTYGVADISATGLKKTSWWEIKMLTPSKPEIKKQPTQEFRMLRLATYGYAKYVVFEIWPDGAKSTYIFNPIDLPNWREAAEVRGGFDYNWIIDEVLKIHGQD